MRRTLIGVLGLLVTFCSSVLAQGKDWKKALEYHLTQAYPLTELSRGFFTPAGTLGKTGIELIVQKRGLVSQDDPDAFIVRNTRIRHGEVVKEVSAVGTDHYLLQVGDRIYVRTIRVDDDKVWFRYMTADLITRTGGGGRQNTGNTTQSRFWGIVVFEFDKGYLASASADDVIKEISTVLSTESQAASAKTISLGQTFDQVEQILGKPDNIAKLGAKTIYTYRNTNMKVVFMDGKVSDVQ